MNKNYKVFRTNDATDKNLLHLIDLADEQNTWADFILQDHMNMKYWEQLHKEFPSFQFFLLDENKPVGCGNCVPLHLESRDLSKLPDEGWDWVLSHAFESKELKLELNTLAALQIAINPAYRGEGISGILVNEMKKIALENGFEDFILPVRPNQKHKYPLIAIDEYIKWQNKEGLPYDAWIRVHAKNGAEIVKSCKKSMYVSGTIEEWEEWTGYDLKSSGQYLFESALTPIEVDIEKNFAYYAEPNVWMHYKL